MAVFNWYCSLNTKTEQEELEEEMLRKIVQKVVAANSDAVTEEKCKNWIDNFYQNKKSFLIHTIQSIFTRTFRGLLNCQNSRMFHLENKDIISSLFNKKVVSASNIVIIFVKIIFLVTKITEYLPVVGEELRAGRLTDPPVVDIQPFTPLPHLLM